MLIKGMKFRAAAHVMSTELLLHYTVHHNWCDFFEASLQQQRPGMFHSTHRCKAYSDLPSSQAATKSRKVAYSLFRIDMLSTADRTLIASVSASLDCFRHIDSKDALYIHLREAGAQHLMPATALLSHDVASIDEVENSLQIFRDGACSSSSGDNLPDAPLLLKAALGSGGFGIYFVNTRSDVLHVAQEHLRMAQEAGPAFLQGLRNESFDGEVPRWSLQRYVKSLRVGDRSNRIQIRAYAAIVCSSASCVCLLYDRDFEARIPHYDVDLDKELSGLREKAGVPVREQKGGEDPGGSADAIEALERRCCEGTSARPYNRERNKAETDRRLLCEMLDPLSSRAVIEGVAGKCDEMLLALEPRLREYCKGSSPNSGSAEMSIAAFDLMLEKNGDIFIVEANFCPAMPQQNKRMSKKYREHIHKLMFSFVQLGYISSQRKEGVEALGFRSVW